MYLRFTRRKKDGKEHRYWSVVESRRCAGGRVVQKPLRVPRRDQRQPARRLVPGDRGLRRGQPALPAACPVSGRTGAARPRQGVRRSGPARGDAAGAAKTVGRVLARLPALRAARARSVLVAATAELARGHPLAPCAADAGLLPADRSGQRVAAAPAVVRAQRDGGPARGRRRAGRQGHPLPLPGQAACPQGGAVLAPARALAGSVRGQLRGAALRPRPTSSRPRPRTKPTNAGTATAATSAATACRW